MMFLSLFSKNLYKYILLYDIELPNLVKIKQQTGVNNYCELIYFSLTKIWVGRDKLAMHLINNEEISSL